MPHYYYYYYYYLYLVLLKEILLFHTPNIHTHVHHSQSVYIRYPHFPTNVHILFVGVNKVWMLECETIMVLTSHYLFVFL